MRKQVNIIVVLLLTICSGQRFRAQSTSPAPYCSGPYSTGACMQGSNQTNNPANGINDFIDFFRATGGSVDIINDSTGCNMNPNNFALYCNKYLAAQQGQTITCTMKSGITFAQGFAIFVDWNQDFTFQVPGERVAATAGVPAAATWTTLVFVIPTNVPNGVYRLRVRCAFATAGTAITPCGTFGFGETEDYNIVVGNVPLSCNVITATATANSTLCAGQSLSLSVATNSCTGLTYTWTGPGNYSSTAQNPVRANVTPTMSGTYSVIVSNSVCPITKTVAVQITPYPVFNVTPATPTICQGGNFVGSASFTNANFSNYAFQWAPTSGSGFIFSQYAPSTSITPLPLPTNVTLSTVIYSITVTPTINPSCSVVKSLTVTINNPSTPSLTMPPPLCNTSAPLNLTATPGGGTWTAHPAVSTGGQLNPNLVTNFGNQTVTYSTSIGNCIVSNTANFSVSKFNTPALTASLNLVCVQDAPHNLMNLAQNTVTGLWSGMAVNNNSFVPAGLPSGVYTATYNTWSQPIATVCPAFTVLSIQVFNPPVPVISPIAPRCTNAPTVALQVTPAGGNWSNSSAVSVGGILTPSLGQPGMNMVSYTAGQGTCLATGTATFHISQFRTAAFTATVPHLCGNYQPFNLLGIVQSTTGMWSGANVSANFFNPSGLNTNIYTLTYSNNSFPDPLLCPDSASIKVSVLNPVNPEITQIGPLCSRDGTVQLKVTPPGGQWVSNAYVSPDGVFTPSMAATGLNPVQYIVGTNTCFAQQTKLVSVEAFVPAILTTKKLPELCNRNLPVNLTPISMNAPGTWSGTAVKGALFDPALSGAGDFTLSFNTASHPGGLCPDRAELAVQVFSLEAPSIAAVPSLCDKSTPVQLQVSPAGGLFKGSNTNAISASGLFNPAYAFEGDNIVSYSISSGPCISFAQTTITVEKFVSAAFAVQPHEAYCVNSPAFDLNSLVFNPGGKWSGDGVNGSMFDPAKAKGALNSISYRTDSKAKGKYCGDSSSILIRVDKMPVISAVSTVARKCSPVEVILNIPSTNAGKAEWYTGDGLTKTGLRTTHIYTSPGSYSVIVNYTLGACVTQASVTTPVLVEEAPVADFSFSKEELSISEPELEVFNESTPFGSNRYTWSINDREQDLPVNPSLRFDVTGNYKITLKATGYNGCSHEVSKTITVKNEFSVFIPNSFTPNADGVNDQFRPVFSPYGLDANTYSMEIFDRWGIPVFSTSDVNKGWDGSFRNKSDVPMKQETYVYKIKFKDTEGQLYHRSGYVTLLD